MARAKEQFIEEVAIAVQKYAPQFGVKVCSPIIAQACLESAYGTSSKGQRNNLFGLKYREGRVNCHNEVFQEESKEQNTDGSYLNIKTSWYSFASIDLGVKGYFQFINISRYANVKGVTDPKTYLENIKTDGYATSINYVTNLMNVINQWNLTKYDNIKEEKPMGYTNSSLVNCVVKSPNHSGTRTHRIDRITPHCVVGQLSAEAIGGCFKSASRRASCNYGIGPDGRVCLIVDEANRSWCTSSNANDQRAITIEVASDKTHPYAFKPAAYEKLVELCIDICKRNGIKKLLWLETKERSLTYQPKDDEAILTCHRWFAAKACPGDWMFAREGDLAARVTAALNGDAVSAPSAPSTQTPAETTTPSALPSVPFQVQVIRNDYNYRANPSMSGKVKGQTGKGKFTIVEVKDGWGKLKSGVGWIYLHNKTNVVILGATNQSTTSKANFPYTAKTKALTTIKQSPNASSKTIKTLLTSGVYTIVDEENGFGLLKSYQKWRNGWIALSSIKQKM